VSQLAACVPLAASCSPQPRRRQEPPDLPGRWGNNSDSGDGGGGGQGFGGWRVQYSWGGRGYGGEESGIHRRAVSLDGVSGQAAGAGQNAGRPPEWLRGLFARR
jgi:hypothetical protein